MKKFLSLLLVPIIAVLSFGVSINADAEELTAGQAAAEYLLRDLESSSLSDVEKALIVHDRLAAWVEYDYENYQSDTIPAISFTTEGALANRVAVCAGYAAAYKYLMEKIGIECEYVTSDALNHAWNIVVVNGKRYHVDVTWDDPVADVYSRVYHTNFLRSTTGLTSTGHNATDYDSTPTDTTYDKYYWQNSISEFQYFKGEIYYIDNANNVIKKYSTDYTSATTLITLASGYPWGQYTWIDKDKTIKCSNFSHLCSDDNYIYYSTADGIFRLSGSTGTRLYTSSDLKVIGFRINNGSFNIERSSGCSYGTDYSLRATNGVTMQYGLPVTGLTVSPTSKTLSIGETLQLTAVISPADATNQNLSWVSSDKSIVTVTAAGLVTAVTAGEATVTVTSVESDYTADCIITVQNTTITSVVKLVPTSESSTAMIERDQTIETYNSLTSDEIPATATSAVTPFDNTYGSYSSTDYTNWFVSGLTTGMLPADLDNYISVTGGGSYQVSNLSVNGRVGTGTIIKVYDKNNSFVEQFYVVIYGDIDSNSRITSADVTEAESELSDGRTWSKSTTLVPYLKKAADLDQNNHYTSADCTAFEQYIVKAVKINQITGCYNTI